MKACRICLNTNSKFYHVTERDLQYLYEDITGYSVSPSDGLPQYLCFECTYRLTTSVDFKRKAIKSCNILTELLRSKVCLDKKSVDSSCKRHHLASTLCKKIFKPNTFDLEITEDEKDDIKIDDLIGVEAPPYVDDELDDYVDDDLEYKPENKDDLETENDNLEIETDDNLPVEIKNEDSFESFLKSEFSTSSDDEILIKKKTTKKKKAAKKSLTKKDKKETKKSEKKEPRQRFKQVISDEIFTITNLNQDEQIQEILKRKESRNFKFSEFKCMECYKGFLDEVAYKSHLIRHTDQSGVYSCDICKVHFKNKYAVRNHAKAHLQKFTCKQCPYVTSRRHAAILHEKYHNGKKYQCPHCKEEFSIAGTYMSHVRLKHTSRHVCLVCGHTFVSVKGLELHTQFKHRFDDTKIPEDGPFCDQCNLRFASEMALQRHMITSAVHNLNGESREAMSKKSPLNKKPDGPKQRKRLKLDEPITCEQCDAQLPDSLSYFRHFRRNHPDKNRTHYPSKRRTQAMCEVCGKLFQSLALLQDHSWTHTDSRPFKCNQCNKSFQRKYRLIAHRRIHANQRKLYACTVCGKRFSTSSNMQRHMFSHTGLKPYKCEMCGKCFKHVSEKRAHVTYVHLKKPWPKRSRGKRQDDRGPPMQPQMPSDIDVVQPLWPACTM